MSRWVVVAGLFMLAACAGPPHLAGKVGVISGCPCMAPIPNVGDRVFFDFNKSDLNVDGDATLRRQASWLAKYPNLDVLVAGNTDERGTETYNLALGERRAWRARDGLVADGVAPARIKTVSYGKDCPVAAGHGTASYQQNRNAITSVQGFNAQHCGAR